jgi:hypothetical protein
MHLHVSPAESSPSLPSDFGRIQIALQNHLKRPLSAHPDAQILDQPRKITHLDAENNSNIHMVTVKKNPSQ